MSKQKDKYHLAMSGEYYVAAELHRRGIAASVTYGNAKKADVIAMSEDGERALVIEVKTTAQSKWVVGQYVPEPSERIWVFVYVPTEELSTPSFFVMTQSEIHAILHPITEEYNRRYREKYGVEYGDKPGVCSLKRDLITRSESAWGKITARLDN